MVLSKVELNSSIENTLNKILLKGFSRVKINNDILRINEVSDFSSFNKEDKIWIVVDRLTTNHDDDNLNRLADSVEIALYEGEGRCALDFGKNELINFSNLYELDGMIFDLPTEHLFSFNNPFGACKMCEGFGSVLGIDEEKVVPNKSLSVYDGAIQCWKGEN